MTLKRSRGGIKKTDRWLVYDYLVRQVVQYITANPIFGCHTMRTVLTATKLIRTKGIYLFCQNYFTKAP